VIGQPSDASALHTAHGLASAPGRTPAVEHRGATGADFSVSATSSRGFISHACRSPVRLAAQDLAQADASLALHPKYSPVADRLRFLVVVARGLPQKARVHWLLT
jgi:hypothetical protein